MGNCSSCLGSRKKTSAGYTLGSSDSSPAEPARAYQPKPAASGSSPKHGKSPDRSEMAEAAEKRAQEAANRGVQQGRGKLAEKLEQERRSGGKKEPEAPEANLQWRVD